MNKQLQSESEYLITKGGYFQFQGGFLHNLVIFICWYKIINDEKRKKWKVWVQDKLFGKQCPSIPDLRVVTPNFRKMNYIIEVESKLTAIKALKKWRQFVTENPGYDLLILNIDDIKDPDSLKSIESYVERMLP